MRFPMVPSARMLPLRWPRAHRAGIFVGLVVVATIPLVGKALLQNSPPNTPRNVPEFLNRQPDFSDQERMRQEHMSQQGFEAINALRKKQVTDDSTRLLKLASDLKAEIDDTGKDTVSQSTLQKAEMIEKLARNIKQKMTVTVLPN
jgi:hypothetical protein